jgi:hypothetical protein
LEGVARVFDLAVLFRVGPCGKLIEAVAESQVYCISKGRTVSSVL